MAYFGIRNDLTMAASHADFLFLFLMLSWPYVLRWDCGGGTTSAESYRTAAKSNLASGRNVSKASALLGEEDICSATHHVIHPWILMS